MKMSSFPLLVALLAVVLVATAALAQDDDFGFDVSDDFEVEIDGGSRKLWNNKEITAVAGKVFHFVIPAESVGKDVESYEVKRATGAPLPLWILFDKIGGIFWGVPLQEDVGTLHLVIRALGSDKNTTQEIAITVLETSDLKDKCAANEDNTVLTLLIDKGVRAIKPKQRVMAINNLAQFFGLPYSAFTLKPELKKDDITDSSVVLAGPGNLRSRTSKMTSLLQVPVGCDGRLWVQTASLVHQLKQQARDGTITEVLGLPLIGWRVKTETKPVVRAKRQLDDYGSGDYDDYYDDNYDEDEYDEEDAETTEKAFISPPTTTTTTPRPTHPHRHHHGEVITSEETESSIPQIAREHQQNSSPRIDVQTVAETLPVIPETTPTTTTSTTTTSTTTARTTTEEIKPIPPSTTTTTRSEITSQKTENYNPSYDYDYDYDSEDDDEEDPVESKTEVPTVMVPKQTETSTPLSTTSTSTMRSTTREIAIETIAPTISTERGTTLMIIEDTEPSTVVYAEPVEETVPPTTSTTTAQPLPTTVMTIPITATTTTAAPTTTTTTQVPIVTITEVDLEEDQPSTTRLTTTRQALSTARTTTTREITESVEYEAKNFAPSLDNRLKQMSVIAGKIFRFVVPNNTFSDFEDGHNLTLEFLNSNGEPLSKDSWCNFNPARREIYGLPLEEDVSKWDYKLKAIDKEGASVSENVSIQVQQHKLQRVVNHEISLYMRIEKKQEFAHFVDWCLKTLRALGRIYNTNMSEITVRHVNFTSEPVVFTWTNDSIPTNDCPAKEIDELFKMLTANDRGDPSEKLSMLLAPHLRVKKVTKHGLGVCDTPQIMVTPPTNFQPFLRNPIDHINATVGELLVFKVPDDTFYDPEDSDGRTLNISLLTAERQPLKPNSWLQFDSKNREFYGIPRKSGRNEYQLICIDNGGSSVTDVLEVVVYPAPKVNYNVEFSMTVETQFDIFANSALMQRKFIEKLQEIFGDQNASYIQTNPFKQKQESIIVTWYNKSLSTVNCAHDEINKLESVLKNHDRSISSRVAVIMDPDFPISTIKVMTMGNCRVKPHIPNTLTPTETTKLAHDEKSSVAFDKKSSVPVDEKSSEASSAEYQYLMTFIIPAVIIAVMLFLAAVAACVLYRRRRTGKMNVEEDGRQSYGNKGIPVIFQEELEEKPESGTKTPIILKDEKPPLAPPEYSKSGSLKLTDDSEPYQPPPPFTRTQDNGRQPRPKPTPTYRKPPPYVPP